MILISSLIHHVLERRCSLREELISYHNKYLRAKWIKILQSVFEREDLGYILIDVCIHESLNATPLIKLINIKSRASISHLVYQHADHLGSLKSNFRRFLEFTKLNEHVKIDFFKSLKHSLFPSWLFSLISWERNLIRALSAHLVRRYRRLCSKDLRVMLSQRPLLETPCVIELWLRCWSRCLLHLICWLENLCWAFVCCRLRRCDLKLLSRYIILNSELLNQSSISSLRSKSVHRAV